MKTLYFIRHGETDYNRKWRYQHALVPLNAHGRIQARKLSKHFKKTPIDLIVASDTLRASQTAEQLQKEVKAPIEYSPALGEYRRASSLVNASYFHPKSLYTIGMSIVWAADPAWRFEDGETAMELNHRARRELKWLLNKNEQSIAIVSHRLFIAAMLSELEDSCNQSFSMFMSDLLRANAMHNTGVTKVMWEDGDELSDNVVIEYRNNAEHLES